MNLTTRLALGTCGFLIGASIAVSAAQTTEPTVLTIFAAGTLAGPFKQANALFEKQYPKVTVQAQYGGSVMMAKRITDLHQDADLLAVADYNVIPKFMFGSQPHASWYAGFARNAITFVYTEKSKYANEINSRNWYKVLARPGVEIGRSNPDTDPSCYQTVQMLHLAEKYYNAPGLQQKVLANAPLANMRHRNRSDFRAAAQADRLSSNLSLRRPAASSQVPRPTGQDQSQRSGTHRLFISKALPTPKTALSPAGRSYWP